MAKINILDKSVYNKISAGEVVEKPASVVKELVENALDAGAPKIFVRIEQGGLGLIEVSDNGCGIEKSELNKVFLPHSTSKICDSEDLFQIQTLGFRGEAMASIASISKVKIESAVEGETGYSLSVEGGILGEILPTSHAVGTTVVVKDLFYNTPARLKFMRKPKSEERDVCSVIERACFSNPFVAFEFVTESGVQICTKGEGLLEALAVVYGNDILDNLLEINAEEYGMQLFGFISNTSYPKPTRAYQTFIVNGRVVTGVSLVTALNNAYTDYFVKRSYPLAVLCLKIKPQEIDVNVHPQKSEIRFEYQSKVFSFIQRNIKRCLEESLKSKVLVNELGGIVTDEWTKPFTPDTESLTQVASPTPTKEGLLSVKKSEPRSILNDSLGENKRTGNQLLSSNNNQLSETENLEKSTEEDTSNRYLKELEDLKEETNFDTPQIDERILPQINEIETNQSTSTNRTNLIANDYKTGVTFKIVGQLFSTYIILEYEDKALLIDQHAACEFINYLELKEQLEKGELVVQPLLLPFVFSIATNEEIPDDRLVQLREIGFEINQIDSNKYELISLPSILAGADLNRLVNSFISDEDVDLPIKERLMYTACHASIRGNTHLDEKGIELFLRCVFKRGLYPKCPHGRPAYLIYTKKDIEKLFLRIV